MRRRNPTTTEIVELDALEWRVLAAIKREFAKGEIVRDVWANRAREAGVSLAEFERIGTALNARGVIGRFSTFLEHVKPNEAGETRHALQRALSLGRSAGPRNRSRRRSRAPFLHDARVLREGGPEFRNVNVMGVLHGTEKETVMGAQGRDRRALARSGHRIQLHQRVLGRTQRDQALGDLSAGLRRLLQRARARSRCAAQ